MTHSPRPWCAILAAGRGERFGGGKLAVPLGGRPLLLWALEAALWSGLERVLLVLGQSAEALRPLLPADPRLEVLVNPRHQEGIGTSLALAAARAQAAGVSGLAVLLGDMPLVSPCLLAAVATAALSAPAGLAAASLPGRRGHPVAFAARHLPDLMLLVGDEGGRKLLERQTQGLALVPAPPASQRDVDRPEDLASVEILLYESAPRPGLAGLAAALGLEQPGLYGLIGSGGKTSLLYALAAELATQGQAVAVTTSTHVSPPPAGKSAEPWLLGADLPQAGELLLRLAQLQEWGQPLFLAAKRTLDGKLKGLASEQLAALAAVPGLWVLSEADGAAGRPLKSWASYEPALTGQEAGVIVLAGASCLGRPLEAAWVHRPELFAQGSGLALGETVTPAALARLLASPQGPWQTPGKGPWRGISPGLKPTLVINQSESAPPESLRQLGAALLAQERWRGVLSASLRLSWFRSCPPSS